MCLSHGWRKDLLVQRYLEVRLEEKGCGAAGRMGRIDVTGGSWCFHVEFFVGLRKSNQIPRWELGSGNSFLGLSTVPGPILLGRICTKSF